MIVQIYEVTTSAEARALGAMGVDHSAFWSAQLLTLKAEFPQISLMRSIPVVDESSIALARSYDGIADSFFSIAPNPVIARSGPWA
jgi:hypothetical protein